MKHKFIRKIVTPCTILFNSLRVKSIQFVITISFMLVTILAMLFVGIAINNMVSNLTEQNATLTTCQIIDQVNLNLDYYLRSMMEISDYLMDEIAAIRNDIGNYSLYILIFGILIAFSISAFISARISKPIKQLEKYMKQVEQGRFDIDLEVKGEAEVAHLSRTLNLMVARIKRLMDQIVHEQEVKRISELNALQAQINSHFLYNTLDSIIWMAENGKSPDVITMVTALARLFRISISRGRNIISVQEELEHARNYLIIQNIRYKNKLKYEITVQEETLQYRTLKLILQPIIENSIYHGKI